MYLMERASSAQSSMEVDQLRLSDQACGLACGCMQQKPGAAGLDWLPSLLRQQFFTPCRLHRDCKKSEVTHFCLTCGPSCAPLCPHCLPAHAGHQTLQVRRYVYCDVVRACDMNNFVDVTGVQSYIINQAKVIFLAPRPNSKQAVQGGMEAGCLNCHRCLREGCSYCCLSCKVEAMVGAGELDLPAFTGVTSDSSEACHLPLGDTDEEGTGVAAVGGVLLGMQNSMQGAGAGAGPRVERRLDLSLGLDRSGSARSSTDGSDLDSYPSSSAGSFSRRKQMSPRRSPVY